jgi:hypothetical protein
MTKLKIEILPGFESEKRYILDIIIGEYLGIDYELIVNSESKGYELFFSETKLVIEDHFFKNVIDGNYLSAKYLPSGVEIMNNIFLIEKDMPVIYGSDEVILDNGTTNCRADIFASAFFMLTRWEELVIADKDNHQRFPVTSSHSFINNYLQRPVVNEYTEFLWNLLVNAGYKGQRKEFQYKLYITHDVDFIIKWRTFFHFAKSFAGDLIRRRSLRLAFSNTKWYAKFLSNNKKDPYDCFSELMDLSEEIENKSYFFFIPGGKTKYEKHYKINSTRFKKLTEEIAERNHFCGIHPSYNTFIDNELLKQEKANLEEITGKEILFGRQHYLRFSVPKTWQYWEKSGLQWDSTLYYTYNFGFRTGTCIPYSVFDVEKREKLKLKEKTMCLMDVSLFSTGLNEEIEKAVFMQIDRVRKCHGEYVILWHNSNFNTHEWKHLKEFYKRILKYADQRTK